MCGILIAYAPNPVDRDRFDAARDTLIHRGPDAQHSVYLEDGRLALGHTRLSIIDLSSRANQPMQSDKLWVTFNGEIYNYPELRHDLEAKGCRFVTTSDTEVLLHGYRIWGESLCERLNGMFAFAIWDSAAKRLFLGRDHFGQKPLYYADIGGEFIAASEIKAIRSYARHTFRLRRESIVDAMVQDFVAEPNTWFQDIKVLPAGHQMTVQQSSGARTGLAIRNYWSFSPDPDPKPISEIHALERLTGEIEHAVRSHLLADVEVGSFLSGGIDSTCVTTLASYMVDSQIKTFSIGFGGEDELPLARETATSIGSKHYEDVVSETDFQSFEERALHLFDHPFADTSLIPTERVAMLAAGKVKVVLTGDGGDETFGGYDYGRFLAPNLIAAKPFEPSLKGVRDLLHSWWDSCLWSTLGAERWALTARERLLESRQPSKRRLSILAPQLLADLRSYDPSSAYRQHRSMELSPFRDAQWVGIKVPLPSRMLVKVDRCSMAHSLEARAPLLSPTLAEFMLSLPVTTSNPENNWYKGLLRKWLDGKISGNVLGAKKRGFDLPSRWAAVNSETLKENEELLPRCVDASFIRPLGWRKLSNAPRVLWYFVQIERALEKGILSC